MRARGIGPGCARHQRAVRARIHRLVRAGAHVLGVAAAIGVSPAAGAGLRAQAAPPAFADSARLSVAAARASAIRGPSELQAAGRRYAGAVRHCYEESGLKEDPTLRGLLRVTMMVLPDGAVRAATATATRVRGLGMAAVTECVSAAARTWHFRDGATRADRVVLWFDLLPADL